MELTIIFVWNCAHFVPFFLLFNINWSNLKGFQGILGNWCGQCQCWLQQLQIIVLITGGGLTLNCGCGYSSLQSILLLNIKLICIYLFFGTISGIWSSFGPHPTLFNQFLAQNCWPLFPPSIWLFCGTPLINWLENVRIFWPPPLNAYWDWEGDGDWWPRMMGENWPKEVGDAEGGVHENAT